MVVKFSHTSSTWCTWCIKCILVCGSELDSPCDHESKTDRALFSAWVCVCNKHTYRHTGNIVDAIALNPKVLYHPELKALCYSTCKNPTEWFLELTL